MAPVARLAAEEQLRGIARPNYTLIERIVSIAPLVVTFSSGARRL